MGNFRSTLQPGPVENVLPGGKHKWPKVFLVERVVGGLGAVERVRIA